MAYSQAQNKATQKYVKENYERLYITVKKGQKEKIKTISSKCGESMNEFIQKSIEERMEREEKPD